MSLRIGLSLGVLLVGFALGTPARATLIDPISQTRNVMATAASPDGSDSDSAAAADFGPFDQSVSASVSGPSGAYDAAASQTSQILNDRLTGLGSATASAFDLFDANSNSRFTIAFDLAQTVDYTLDFRLTALQSLGIFGLAFASLELSGGPGNQIIHKFSANGDSVIVAEDFLQGTLLPGSYDFDVFASSNPGANASSSDSTFNFEFTVVPEPSSSVLLCLGLLVLYAAPPHRSAR